MLINRSLPGGGVFTTRRSLGAAPSAAQRLNVRPVKVKPFMKGKSNGKALTRKLKG